MKKIILSLTLALILVSCGDTYYHNMTFCYPTSDQVAVIYADQPTDTAIFTTTDNFYCSTYKADWITIDPDYVKGNIQYVYQYSNVVYCPLTFTPNTTGEVRTGFLEVRTVGDDDWDNTSYGCWRQLSWLNITQPTPTYTYESYRTVTGASFAMTDSATQISDTLRFTVYGNWTLNSDASFVHINKTNGTKGSNTVSLSVDENTSDADRIANIVLTSCGVADTIKFTQSKKSEE